MKQFINAAIVTSFFCHNGIPYLVGLGSTRNCFESCCNSFNRICGRVAVQIGVGCCKGVVTMTDKELIEVSNRAWDAFVDQMPEEFTGRDLLKIIIRFVVNIANTVDMKPTTVCMLMYDGLNAERHSVKVVNRIKSVLLLASTVVIIVGTACVLWFNYQLGAKIFDVGCICSLACWVFEFVVKVIDRWI